ncbi:MAG: hypothetical protein B6D46_10325 [Polyangiaceae bacterium UTPRO1]|jgi:nucleotide-binding universal stress UspA family protein/CBS domain-containing protein|nr:universal stress protein [Myxococcales bacterium]OQY66559.1 MAG: hypothetical protein B6D46_10325 [Polyangiaceae bacterium UTPRO1]
MTTFANILVPIDYEAPADAALRAAGALARAAKGRLLVVHALPLPIYTMAEYPIVPIDGAWVRDETERLREHVRSVLEPEGEVPAFEVDVRVDTPALRILQLAAERRVDVIVMGTHGRSGIKHLLLGSVASKVARLAPCPVLTVPAHGRPKLGALTAEAQAAGRAPAAATTAGPGEVGEVMRYVAITVGPEEMLEDARVKMAQHRIRHLPVVENAKLVGMLSSVDFGPYIGQLARTKVHAAMTADPTTVGSGVDTATAARLMLERRVRALPVVDGERVVGVISASDILEEYARAART